MSKYTPGRWTVIEGKYGNLRIEEERQGDNRYVAEVSPDNPNQMDDARLIAAAPELLSAGAALVAAARELLRAHDAGEAELDFGPLRRAVEGVKP